MNKVLLIRPDNPKDAPVGKLPPNVPMSLAFLAGVLEREGFDVAVLDNYLLEEDKNYLAKKIQEIKPDLIGVTCNIATTPTTAEIVEIGAEEGIPVVVGGPQVTIAPQDTMKRVGANIGVVGEGEVTFLELCRVLSKGGNIEEGNLRKIPGIVFRGNDGNFVLTEQSGHIKDMDALPFLPLHLFSYEKYPRSTPEMKTTPVDWMSTSRGCPFDCAFCSNIHVWGRNYRFMSAKRIADEVEHMVTRYGTRAIEFREDNFTANKKRVVELCNLLKERQLKIDWMCESRVDLVSEELLDLMSSAGCRTIFFGVESGTQRVLDYLRKGITVRQVEETFRACKKAGISGVASVMIGIPGQTLAEHRDTLRLVRKIDADIVYFNPFMGYPGTDIYRYILDNNLVYSRWETIVLPNSEDMTWPEKILFKQKAELLYNLRPRVLLRHLKRMGIKRFLKKGILTFSRYFQLWKFNLTANR